MADKIKVNTGSLKTTKGNVSAQIEKIREQIRTMYGEISALNNMWEGPAHDTFDQTFRKDVAKLEALCTSLDGIVRYEENAITEYEKCEKNVASLIAQLKV